MTSRWTWWRPSWTNPSGDSTRNPFRMLREELLKEITLDGRRLRAGQGTVHRWIDRLLVVDLNELTCERHDVRHFTIALFPLTKSNSTSIAAS